MYSKDGYPWFPSDLEEEAGPDQLQDPPATVEQFQGPPLGEPPFEEVQPQGPPASMEEVQGPTLPVEQLPGPARQDKDAQQGKGNYINRCRLSLRFNWGGGGNFASIKLANNCPFEIKIKWYL